MRPPERDAPELVESSTQNGRTGEAVEAPSIIPNSPDAQRTIRAEARGSDICTAEGITACASSPVFELCRALIAAGVDPGRPLEVWRGDMLALTVRSLADGAALEIAANGVGFRRLRKADAGSHVQQNEPGGHL